MKQIDPGKAILERDGKRIELRNDAVIVSGVLPTPLLKEIGILVETKCGTA